MGRLKKILRRILLKIFPELNNITGNVVCWNSVKNNITNSEIAQNAFMADIYSVNNSTVGEYTSIATNAKISLTKIGKYCSIGPNFISGWGIHPIDGISTSPIFYSKKHSTGKTYSKTNKIIERFEIVIGNDVWIGANCFILDGCIIGDGAIIAAGSVVTKDVPEYAIVGGLPAKIIKYRFSENQIKNLLATKWWDSDEKVKKDVEEYFFEVDKFIEKNKFSKI